jgi:hypothetical protein
MKIVLHCFLFISGLIQAQTITGNFANLSK